MLKDDIRSVTYLKSHAADLLDQLNENRRPIVITQNGEPRAVVLDPDSYDQMRSAMGLLKLIADGESAVRAGKTEEQDALFGRLENKFREK